MLAAAEANRLNVTNCIKLTNDGQYVVTASLCGPPQVRNVTVRSFMRTCSRGEGDTHYPWSDVCVVHGLPNPTSKEPAVANIQHCCSSYQFSLRVNRVQVRSNGYTRDPTYKES